MPSKTILFATDLSPLSDAVLPVATSIAGQRRHSLSSSTSRNRPLVSQWVSGCMALWSQLQMPWTIHERVIPTDPLVPSEYLMGMGEPANEIVPRGGRNRSSRVDCDEHARPHGLASIHHGQRGGKGRAKSRLPVLIVKPFLKGSEGCSQCI